MRRSRPLVTPSFCCLILKKAVQQCQCKAGFEEGHALCGVAGGLTQCAAGDTTNPLNGKCACDGGYSGEHCDSVCGTTMLQPAHCAFKPKGLAALDDGKTLRTPATITRSRDYPDTSELTCATPTFPTGYSDVSVEVSFQNSKRVDAAKYATAVICEDEPSLPAQEELTTNGISLKVF